jgi:hypothetical protein
VMSIRELGLIERAFFLELKLACGLKN